MPGSTFIVPGLYLYHLTAVAFGYLVANAVRIVAGTGMVSSKDRVTSCMETIPGEFGLVLFEKALLLVIITAANNKSSAFINHSF